MRGLRRVGRGVDPECGSGTAGSAGPDAIGAGRPCPPSIMMTMDTSEITAVLALLAIPVSILLARWQMRTIQRQTEASHRAALEVAETARQSTLAAAEANHRSAMELAEANHRRVLEAAEAQHMRDLELARNQAEIERVRWLTEARRADYRLFQTALSQFGRALLTRDLVVAQVTDAFDALHQAELVIQSMGPEEVYLIAREISVRCRSIDMRVGRPHAPEERLDWWSEVRPFRDELHDAVKRILEDPWTA